MRCKNCGWPNKPSETACVKCNSPLSSDDDEMDIVGGGDMSQSSRPLNKTVLEGDVLVQMNQIAVSMVLFKR